MRAIRERAHHRAEKKARLDSLRSRHDELVREKLRVTDRGRKVRVVLSTSLYPCSYMRVCLYLFLGIEVYIGAAFFGY